MRLRTIRGTPYDPTALSDQLPDDLLMILTGYLREVMSCPIEAPCSSNTNSMFFECLDGTRIEIKETRSNTPRNVLIEAFIDASLKIIHFNVLKSSFVDNLNKDIAFLYVLERGQTANESHYTAAKRMSLEFESELKKVGKGVWDVSVTPYVIEGYDGPRDVLTANWNWLRQNSNPNHTYYHAKGGSKSGLRGESYVNHRFSWTYSIGDLHTLMHEQGHAFGLRHSNSEMGEYGGEGIMSVYGRSHIAPQQTIIRTIDMEAVYELEPNTSAEVFLIDGDSDTTARIPDTFKGILVRSSYQSPCMVSIFKGRVFTHYADGHSFESTISRPPDFPLNLIESQRGIHKVSVKWSHEAPTPPSKPFPVEPDPLVALQPKSGLYYRPDASMQGFDCYFEPDYTQIFWATFDSTKTTSETHWYAIEGRKGQNLLIHDPRQNMGVVGGAKVYSEKPNELTIRYWFDTGTRGVEHLQLLAAKEHPTPIKASAGADRVWYSKTDRESLPSVGYVYELQRVLSPLGRIHKGNWYLLIDGKVYSPEDAFYRIETNAKLIELGNYIEYNNGLQYLNKRVEFID